MNVPQVNIIIPAYNAAQWLSETFASVQAQSFTDWEMIIVDDGSTDGTASVAQKLADQDARIRLVRQSNRGPCAARNAGFAQARGEAPYVIFLDADDLWEIDALETLVTALDNNPAACGAYGYCRYMDGQGRLCREGELEAFHRERFQVAEDGSLQTVPPHEPTTFRVLSVFAPIVTPGSVLLRSRYVAVNGLFDEQIRGYEDWEYLARLTQNGSLVWLDKPVLRYRWHGANLSQDGKRMAMEERAARRKLLRYFPKSTPEGRIMRLGAWYRRLLNVRNHRLSARKNLMAGRIVPASLDTLRSMRQLWFGLRRI